MVFEPYLHARLPGDYASEQIEQLLAVKFTCIVDLLVREQWPFDDTYDWRL